MKIEDTAREIAWTYFSFRGRITRSRFWWSNVGLNIVQSVAQLAFGAPSTVIPFGTVGDAEPLPPRRLVGSAIIALVVLYPTAALFVKRAHDRNRPAWMSFSILAILIVGSVISGAYWPPAVTLIYIGFLIYVIVDLLFLPSNRGENRFGPPPKSRLDETLKPVVLEG